MIRLSAFNFEHGTYPTLLRLPYPNKAYGSYRHVRYFCPDQEAEDDNPGHKGKACPCEALKIFLVFDGERDHVWHVMWKRESLAFRIPKEKKIYFILLVKFCFVLFFSLQFGSVAVSLYSFI